MFDRLAANPASYRSAPSTLAASFVAALILALLVLCLVILVWGTFHATGMGWVAVVLGWLVVVAVRPRVPRLPRDAVVLDPSDFPGVHALVGQMAKAVGVPKPRIVAVDVDFNAYVMPVGIFGRPAIVLGLPLMTLLPWHARLGLIGHELGHLRGRDTTRGRLVAAALHAVAGMHYVLTPAEEDLYLAADPELEPAMGFAAVIARGVQAILASPFLLLWMVLDRLTLTGGQHREYLADRRSAEVVGSESLVEFLVLDLEGIVTATTAAARRGEDPFGYLASRPSPTSAQRAARVTELDTVPHRADATHPPDGLRIRLLQGDPRPPSPAAPTEVDCGRAEQELVALRASARKEFSEALRFGPYA